jgi:hypothetical protein
MSDTVTVIFEITGYNYTNTLLSYKRVEILQPGEIPSELAKFEEDHQGQFEWWSVSAQIKE